MKILHVFGQMGYGGAEMRTLDLMRNVDRERYCFDFCALSGRKGPLEEEIRRLGGEVFHCDIRAPLFAIRFVRLLGRGGYDVVHSHVHHSSGLILALARLCRVSGRIAHFRSTQDGREATMGRRVQREAMKKLLDWNATGILAVGRSAMEASWKSNWQQDSRCEAIPNGLDTVPFEMAADPGGVRREFGMPEGSELLIHVGRMSMPKNHVRVAEVAAILLSEKKDRRVLFAGKENEGIKLAMEERFSARGVLGQVCFAGERRDVPRLLKGSDLFVFPSLWEGLPGALLEACAAGTPALASDIAANRELGGTFPGIRLLGLEASDEKWAAAARTLLERRPVEGDRKAALAHIRTTEYSIERCAQAHARAWESSVARGRRHGSHSKAGED